MSDQSDSQRAAARKRIGLGGALAAAGLTLIWLTLEPVDGLLGAVRVVGMAAALFGLFFLLDEASGRTGRKIGFMRAGARMLRSGWVDRILVAMTALAVAGAATIWLLIFID